MIVFPAIDLRCGRCVRLRQGRAEDEIVYDDDPAAVARRWVSQGAEWLHLVNLDGAFGAQPGGAPAHQPLNLQRLEDIRAAVPGTRIQFGGGVRSLEDVERALTLGATRVILGTVAVKSPELVAEAAQRFGAEQIVIALDARGARQRVVIHGWQQASDMTAAALGKIMRTRGVRYAIYTDIVRDGMLTGVNVEGTAALAQATGLRVIASGGVASLEDIRRLGLRAQAGAGIEGVIIGQALYTGTVSLAGAIQIAREI